MLHFALQPARQYHDSLVCRVNAIAGHHPLGELDHVQPAFLRLDLGDKGLWLFQTLCQVSLRQASIKAHLPEPLAQVNVFRCAKCLGQVTACLSSVGSRLIPC